MDSNLYRFADDSVRDDSHPKVIYPEGLIGLATKYMKAKNEKVHQIGDWNEQYTGKEEGKHRWNNFFFTLRKVHDLTAIFKGAGEESTAAILTFVLGEMIETGTLEFNGDQTPDEKIEQITRAIKDEAGFLLPPDLQADLKTKLEEVKRKKVETAEKKVDLEDTAVSVTDYNNE